MSSAVYDKIIIGGGIAGLSAAHEMLEAARTAGRNINLIVLTERINAPSAAGTHLLSGFDGFERDQPVPFAEKACRLVRQGLDRIGEIVSGRGMSCRYDLHYQLIAPDPSLNVEMAAFHTARHHYGPGTFHALDTPRDRVQLAGFAHALGSSAIGQINAVEFIHGLVGSIRDLGGEVREGVSYVSHSPDGSGVRVSTSKGDYVTSSPILMAGGPHLMSRMGGLPVQVTPLYTIAGHVELSPEHARQICVRPVAFFSSTTSYLWGSLDSRNVLTFGHGVCEGPEGRSLLEHQLRETFRRICPGLFEAYADRLDFSFDAMAFTANQLPVVGRLSDYDVITGNCGRGFAQSFAEARAYAEWVIHGNDDDLRLFESFNIRG